MTEALYKPRQTTFPLKRPVRSTFACVTIILVSALFVVLCKPAVLLIPLPPPPVPASENAIAAPALGKFSPILFDQGISHDQFHVRATKLMLAAMFRKHSRTAVVGVASGGDVVFLAHEKYDVYAFDPMTKSIQLVTKWAKSIKVDSRVHAHRVAASEVSGGTIEVEYLSDGFRQREKAPRARIDDYVQGPLDVLSLDIQGGEWDVLRGAMKIVNGPGVRSMWIEIHPCNPKVPPMLRALDRLGYAMFDMVPVGSTKATLKRESLFDAPGAASKGWRKRPPGFDAYFKWMCDLQKTEWKWIQSDILAVKRELLTDEVLFKLRSLSADVIQFYESRGKLTNSV